MPPSAATTGSAIRPPLAQLAQVELALGLEPDDEEEERHQALVDPVAQVVRDARSRRAGSTARSSRPTRRSPTTASSPTPARRRSRRAAPTAPPVSVLRKSRTGAARLRAHAVRPLGRSTISDEVSGRAMLGRRLRRPGGRRPGAMVDAGARTRRRAASCRPTRPRTPCSTATGRLAITARAGAGRDADVGAARSRRAPSPSATGASRRRIRVPAGRGVWPAFWMLGADIDGVGLARVRRDRRDGGRCGAPAARRARARCHGPGLRRRRARDRHRAREWRAARAAHASRSGGPLTRQLDGVGRTRALPGDSQGGSADLQRSRSCAGRWPPRRRRGSRRQRGGAVVRRTTRRSSSLLGERRRRRRRRPASSRSRPRRPLSYERLGDGREPDVGRHLEVVEADDARGRRARRSPRARPPRARRAPACRTPRRSRSAARRARAARA